MKFSETTSTKDEIKICRQFLGNKFNYNYFGTENLVDQSSKPRTSAIETPEKTSITIHAHIFKTQPCVLYCACDPIKFIIYISHHTKSLECNQM